MLLFTLLLVYFAIAVGIDPESGGLVQRLISQREELVQVVIMMMLGTLRIMMMKVTMKMMMMKVMTKTLVIQTIQRHLWPFSMKGPEFCAAIYIPETIVGVKIGAEKTLRE